MVQYEITHRDLVCFIWTRLFKLIIFFLFSKSCEYIVWFDLIWSPPKKKIPCSCSLFFLQLVLIDLISNLSSLIMVIFVGADHRFMPYLVALVTYCIRSPPTSERNMTFFATMMTRWIIFLFILTFVLIVCTIFVACSIFLFGEFSLIPCSSSYSPCISSIVLWFGAV